MKTISFEKEKRENQMKKIHFALLFVATTPTLANILKILKHLLRVDSCRECRKFENFVRLATAGITHTRGYPRTTLMCLVEPFPRRK